MDQLVSDQPGLIPQMAGFLTNLQIWGATICVDHYSDYVYVALMQDLGLDKTHLQNRLLSVMQVMVGFLLFPIEQTTVILQMLDFKKQLRMQISPLLFVQLVHIIKMVSLNGASRS